MMRILLLSIFSMLAFSVSAQPPAAGTPPPGRPGEGRLSRHIWRAFSELSDAERKEMMKLQRENPDKFMEVMKKRAEAFFKAEKAERQRISELAQKYRDTQNKSQKEKIRTEISTILKKRFDRRLSLNRKHVESMKRRTEMLEKELNKRAANADKIILVQLDAVLEGKELRPPRRPHRYPDAKKNTFRGPEK